MKFKVGDQLVYPKEPAYLDVVTKIHLNIKEYTIQCTLTKTIFRALAEDLEKHAVLYIERNDILKGLL